jgi:hypothetical protein
LKITKPLVAGPDWTSPFFCVIARARNEPVNLRAFVPHYLEEGADLIVIVDDRSEPPVVANPNWPLDVVRIRQANLYESLNGTDDQMSTVRKIVDTEMMDCTWVASVDADEFMTTKRFPSTTVRDELHLNKLLARADSIHVPWVMFAFEHPDQEVEHVRQDLTMRMNHSLHHGRMEDTPNFEMRRTFKSMDRYSKIETKPVFRPVKMRLETPHTTAARVHTIGKCNRMDGAKGKEMARWNPHCKGCPLTCGTKFHHFHEKELSRAFLVIYHYRFHNRRSIERKCKATDSITSFYNSNATAAWNPLAGAGYNGTKHGEIATNRKPTSTTHCILDMLSANYPEITDETLSRKANRRRGKRPPPTLPSRRFSSKSGKTLVKAVAKLKLKKK